MPLESSVLTDRSPRFLRLAALLVTVSLGLSSLEAQAQAGRPASRPVGRPTVSVPNFKNTVTQRTWWWQGPVAEDLAAMLANELQATGDLQVVERSNLKEVLSEQELTELGIVRKGSNAAQKGQMTGARYIVLGTVSSYDSNVENKSTGSNFGLLGFRTNKEQVETKDYVAIDIRVVDSSTGEVVGRRTVEGRATNTAEAREQGVSLLPAAVGALLLAPNMGTTGQVLTGAAGTLNFGSNTAQSQRTPAAKAIRAALIDASSYVSCLLAPRGDCMASFDAQDRERRQRTGESLKLE
ncbi:CsgG/HfaB family protein [Synechococcus sp. CS-1324]|nr:CsgG/HfaB family protein [Synechococcus sp. CS-1326]MCT0231246.1 CsgG/HfaB family protein [Synechococcus sp. CS-1324]MCT0234406.1 CsgG/HfaB family protein [Synechococcus sp. CS-1327]PZV03862.1 MAG: penicillin-binding protein activator LpoB [Cyanobium sp.]